MIVTDEVKRTFSKEVENHVISKGGRYMDAVLMKCDDYEIEPQVAAKLISRPISEAARSRIRVAGAATRQLSRIPFDSPEVQTITSF